MIAPNRNQPADPYAEAMASTPDPYAAIERELAAEDAKLGEWPPPQWWSKQARIVNATDPAEYMPLPDPTGTVGIDGPLVNLGTEDDPRPLAVGAPWTTAQKVLVFACIVAAMVLLWAIGGGA